VVTLTSEQRKLIEAKNLAHFVTLMKNGSPQVTPVWIDCDDTHILVNTAEGRQKPLNLARDPRVALSIVDGEDPYRYVQIRGRVVEVTREVLPPRTEPDLSDLHNRQTLSDSFPLAPVALRRSTTSTASSTSRS